MARQTAPDFIDRADRRPAPVRPMALSLVLSLRPSQWTKNLVLFAALIFGQRLLDANAVGRAIAAFVIFCALSGVVYLINDVADREADRLHPVKRNRPIASGQAPCTARMPAAMKASRMTSGREIARRDWQPRG